MLGLKGHIIPQPTGPIATDKSEKRGTEFAWKPRFGSEFGSNPAVTALKLKVWDDDSSVHPCRAGFNGTSAE